MLDIVEALEGSDESRERPHTSSLVEALVVRHVWNDTREQARAALRAVTLSELCERRMQLASTSYMI
jgi:DNA-binding IscR family transcriptional regulator